MDSKAATVQLPAVSFIFEGYEWDDVAEEPVPVYVLVSPGEGCQVPEAVS